MNILLVTRDYPPRVSGGSRRPYLLAQGLRAMGHTVTVATPTPPQSEHHISLPHKSITKDTNTNTTTPPKDTPPQLTEYIKGPLRKWLFWPDPDITWAQSARKILLRHPDITAFNCIITTSPPESIHFIGKTIKSLHTNIFWVADFRDKWLIDPLRSERRLRTRRTLERSIAKSWLESADLICAPTQAILDEIHNYSPHTPTVILPQASEERPAQHAYNFFETQAAYEHGQKTIFHMGRFSKSDPQRTIHKTLQVFKQAHAQRPNLHLYLCGDITAQEHALIKEMQHNMTWLGILNRETALTAMHSSDGLLLVAHTATDAVPGKLAEYLSARKPITIIGDGPWRKAADLEYKDPVASLIDTADGAAQAPIVSSPTPQQAAHILCQKITSALANKAKK